MPIRWCNKDKAALSQFLRDNPELTVEQIRTLLIYRAEAVAMGKVARGLPPAVVLADLINFAGGPVNSFGDPLPTQSQEVRL